MGTLKLPLNQNDFIMQFLTYINITLTNGQLDENNARLVFLVLTSRTFAFKT
jgi:hypothetical protein